MQWSGVLRDVVRVGQGSLGQAGIRLGKVLGRRWLCCSKVVHAVKSFAPQKC